MILLLLGLIISGILGYLIINKFNIRKIMSEREEEGMVSKALALDNKEDAYIKKAIAYQGAKQTDPQGVLMVDKKMSDFVDVSQAGYPSKDTKDYYGKPRKLIKAPNEKTHRDEGSDKIRKCKAIDDCAQLTGKDCGYCASSGIFSFGNAKGPLEDVCKPGQWTMDAAQCKATKDRMLCNSVISCGDLSGDTAEKCGFCPTTGKIMARKSAGRRSTGKTKYVAKYDGDSCSYRDGLLTASECKQFAKDHPCITPYHATGPHTVDCFRKLWKNSGCTGKKPLMKTFEQVKASIPNQGYQAIGKGFKDLYKQTIQSGDMATVMAAYPLCHNKEAQIDPCNPKYQNPYGPKTMMARELCKKKIYKQVGGSKKGKLWWDNLPYKKEGFESKDSALRMKDDKYMAELRKVKRIADTEIVDVKDYPRRLKASMQIYGEKPDKPGGVRPGDYVSYDWKGKPGSKLYGYVIEKNDKSRKFRILWVIRKLKDAEKEVRTTKMTQATQKERFGWHGIKATGEDMKQVGDEFGDIHGGALRVLKRCTPGNTMCGNSCNQLITRLLDMYPRPQNCVVSKWSAYGPCDKMCGGGKKSKTRKIVYPAKRGGTPCPKLKHTIGCNFEPCVNKNFKKAEKRTVKGSVEGVNYVMITGTGYLHVQEVEVYDENGINVAKGGQTTQSSTGWRGRSTKPVDGQKTARRWWARPWANSNHTHGGTNQWWRVKLKGNKLHTITKIIVYNRPDCCYERLRGKELILWQGPPYKWKKVDTYRLKVQRKNEIYVGNRVTMSCNKPTGGIEKMIITKSGNRPRKGTMNEAQCVAFAKKHGYWIGRGSWSHLTHGCVTHGTYADTHMWYNRRNTRGRNCASSSHWCVNKGKSGGSCDSKEFSWTDKKGIENYKKQCKAAGGKPSNKSCLNTNFEKSRYYKDGGDLDWTGLKWFGWNSRKWPIDKCAKKCDEKPGCNRFSFGTTNAYGGWGLGCRISTGSYNNGFAPITTDRYKSHGWRWWNTSNLWGGQVYDRKNTKHKPNNYKVFEYVGDFRDTGRRDLPKYRWRTARWGKRGDAYTCAWRCRNHKYFGLQWWGQCFCGDSYGKYYQHTRSGRNHDYQHRHRWWTYYGGWRNKVYRTPRASRDKWKTCAKYGGVCELPQGGSGKYIMRFGKGKRWTQFQAKRKKEKCSPFGRWGVENPLGSKGSKFIYRGNRPQAQAPRNAGECARHLAARGARMGWRGSWSSIPHGCFTYNHWWYRGRWGGWNNSKRQGRRCGTGWRNRWICVNDKNKGQDNYKSGVCQYKKF